MTSTPARPARPWALLGAGTAAPAACAGPLLAVLGGVGALSAIGALWMPALAITAAAAAIGLVVVRRRRRRAACSTAPAKADLGMPSLRPPDHGPTAPR
ncbi:hypothetical protein [Streptomyces sp. TLI_171]|uniref:hypothetical protein n=1 Tax=Streptomyces sp. TLI_171 TaxID=1938859 RepID=UPI000C613497|nr:hypothetical protein [Streptomyces sp. TLI_171]RKE22844.1 hypothetical protein BX266_6299 [Streptomyces sp. TLI_171]